MIFFHADDYGITKSQTEAINECFSGKLNSISIISNSDYYEKAIRVIPSDCKRVVIHLNFVEGHSVCASEKLPLLTDENGLFTCSFVKILKMNYSSKRKELQKELASEIYAQAKRIIDCDPKKNYSFDSHQHYHIIPVVFNALILVIKRLQKEGVIIEYVRIPVDPLAPIYSSPSLLLKASPKNHVKWMLLKFLSTGERTKLEKLGIRVPVFGCMFYTCQMEKKVVDILYPKYASYADKKNRDLELMFHPGAIFEKEDLLDKKQDDLVEFYSSPYRKKEKDYLCTGL